MNRRPFLYILIISALSLFLGCEEEPSVQKMEQPAGFVELVKAYEDGRVFSSATHKGGACVLDFEGVTASSAPAFEGHNAIRYGVYGRSLRRSVIYSEVGTIYTMHGVQT